MKGKSKSTSRVDEPIANSEAEQSVLGAILLCPQVLDQITHILEPQDFYREAHGRIYQAMISMYKRSDSSGQSRPSLFS